METVNGTTLAGIKNESMQVITGVFNDRLLQGTHRDSDHAIPPGCTSPRIWRPGWISTALTCRVRHYCRRSGLLNMGLLADLILV